MEKKAQLIHLDVDVLNKLKVIAVLEKCNKTSLVQNIITDYVRNYKITLEHLDQMNK